jgi:hypothetical protein
MPKGSIKIDINEKRKFYNQVNYPLIDEYTTAFFDGVNAYGETECESIRLKVCYLMGEIRDKFNLKNDEICKFSFSYHEMTDLLNGKFNNRQSDHLYFIESDKYIKIGRTSCTQIRMSTLRSSNPNNLEYLKVFYGMGYYEFKLHYIFDYLRVHGEWFQKHNDIYEFIQLLKTNNLNIKSKFDYDKPGKTISQSIIYKGTELIYT